MDLNDAAQPAAGPGMPTGPLRPQPLPAEWSTGLMDLLQGIESSMPAMEVLHALHAQLLENPGLADLPALKLFNQVALANLHATVAAAGFIRRILSGDTGPEVTQGLQRQLASMVRTHAAMNRTWTQVSAAPEAARSPAAQSLTQVLALCSQAFRTLEPLIRPLVSPDIFNLAD